MRILVATDGSLGGGAAVRFAVRLAERDPGTELILLTVGGSPAPRDIARARFGGVHPVVRSIAIRGGDGVPETISREADRVKADLVVIGSEGRDTLSEWVVGGVALRLIYVARRPVVVVRPPRRRKRAGV